MVEKKRYVKPAVESEEAMEQTSLACTSTVPNFAEECWMPPNLNTPETCETVPWKGGNFVPDIGCSVFPFAEGCVVALS